MQNLPECFGLPGRTSPGRSQIILADSTANYGSASGNLIRTYSSAIYQAGSSLIYVKDAVNGDSIEVRDPGVYMIIRNETCNAGVEIGLSLNATAADLSTSITSLNQVGPSGPRCMASSSGSSALTRPQIMYCGRLNAGDVIRAHDSTTAGVQGVGLTLQRLNVMQVSA